jgi:hypothetical protein
MHARPFLGEREGFGWLVLDGKKKKKNSGGFGLAKGRVVVLVGFFFFFFFLFLLGLSWNLIPERSLPFFFFFNFFSGFGRKLGRLEVACI